MRLHKPLKLAIISSVFCFTSGFDYFFPSRAKALGYYFTSNAQVTYDADGPGINDRSGLFLNISGRFDFDGTNVSNVDVIGTLSEFDTSGNEVSGWGPFPGPPNNFSTNYIQNFTIGSYGPSPNPIFFFNTAGLNNIQFTLPNPGPDGRTLNQFYPFQEIAFGEVCRSYQDEGNNLCNNNGDGEISSAIDTGPDFPRVTGITGGITSVPVTSSPFVLGALLPILRLRKRYTAAVPRAGINRSS
jgi:hypothetical protein